MSQDTIIKSSNPVLDHSDEEAPVTEQVKEQVRHLGEQAVEGYHAIEERAEAIKAGASELNERAVYFIQENPALAILGAFGAGYLLGTLAARRWII